MLFWETEPRLIEAPHISGRQRKKRPILWSHHRVHHMKLVPPWPLVPSTAMVKPVQLSFPLWTLRHQSRKLLRHLFWQVHWQFLTVKSDVVIGVIFVIIFDVVEVRLETYLRSRWRKFCDSKYFMPDEIQHSHLNRTRNFCFPGFLISFTSLSIEFCINSVTIPFPNRGCFVTLGFLHEENERSVRYLPDKLNHILVVEFLHQTCFSKEIVIAYVSVCAFFGKLCCVKSVGTVN